MTTLIKLFSALILYLSSTYTQRRSLCCVSSSRHVLIRSARSPVNGRYREGLYLLADVVVPTITHPDSYSYLLRLCEATVYAFASALVFLQPLCLGPFATFPHHITINTLCTKVCVNDITNALHLLWYMLQTQKKGCLLCTRRWIVLIADHKHTQ